MLEIRTVLGNIPENKLGKVLPHEHVFCYSDYLYAMAGKEYLDKEKIFQYAFDHIKMMKEKYALSTFIDCTPINIGRDVTFMKDLSEKTGVNIICSSGFYYTEESLFIRTSSETLCEYIVKDAENINAGIIKCAVESEDVSPFNEKLLRATAKAQLKLGLPIVMHTNAQRKNGIKALEIILLEGVKPCCVTVGHLSDTEDVDYIKYFAECGCYVGLDRLYGNYTDEYIANKLRTINSLCEAGYEDRILLSHDALFFSGFNPQNGVIRTPRFNYVFDNILPRLNETLVDKITTENPLKMLKCE